jgi:hypothetical protein
MRRQARKLCARGDQGIDGIKITLQVVKLAAYCSFYLAAAWLLLFSDIEENSACPPTIISGPVGRVPWSGVNPEACDLIAAL